MNNLFIKVEGSREIKGSVIPFILSEQQNDKSFKYE